MALSRFVLLQERERSQRIGSIVRHRLGGYIF
jgi:hypothetical protein